MQRKKKSFEQVADKKCSCIRESKIKSFYVVDDRPLLRMVQRVDAVVQTLHFVAVEIDDLTSVTRVMQKVPID